MAGPFWKGSLSFGLVEIPVALRPAIATGDLGFTLLDRKDFAPVGNKRYNKHTGKEVPWERVIRGYEYEPDEFVAFTDEELHAANVKATQTVEILEFVDAGEIDSVFFDTPYYVEPIKQGSKSYMLLRETLRRTGKVGIARVVLRTRQHLAALVVRDKVLVLNLLHYADEIVPAKHVEAAVQTGSKAVSERELSMAERLVQGMSGKWNPARFHDEYRDDVLALVKRKVKSGQTHTLIEPEKRSKAPGPGADVVDLMPLLKQSLEAHAEGHAGAGRARHTSHDGARSPTRRRSRRRPPARSAGRRTAERRGAKSA